jgi:hypothetical protein
MVSVREEIEAIRRRSLDVVARPAADGRHYEAAPQAMADRARLLEIVAEGPGALAESAVDWKSVADELYMFIVGVMSATRKTPDEGHRRARQMYDEAVAFHTPHSPTPRPESEQYPHGYVIDEGDPPEWIDAECASCGRAIEWDVRNLWSHSG